MARFPFLPTLSLPRRVLLFTLLFGALLLGLDVWRSLHDRAIVIANDKVETANLARSLVQHTHDLVRAGDTLLVGTRRRIEVAALSPDQLDQMEWLTSARFDDLPALSGLFILDAAGHQVTRSLADVPLDLGDAGRAFFRYHRASTDRSLRVSDPLRARSGGGWLILLSRRFDAPGGGFGGVVVVTLSIDELQAYYNGFEVGPHGAISLTLSDGRLLVRNPGGAALVGTDFSRSPLYRELLPRSPVGSIEFTASLDQVRRVGSYLQMDDYPFVMLVAHGLDDVLAGWWVDARLHLSISGAAASLIVLLGHRIGRQIANRQVAEERLAAANRELSALACTDGLTGLANRRRLDEALLVEWHRALRERQPVSLLLLDIDRFKLFNDQYGHQQGDRCLRIVADTVAGVVQRPADLVARYGGEEIAVLLPNTGLFGAGELAEQIRAAIVRAGTPHVGNPPVVVVTGSIGVATRSCDDEADSIEALIARADAALYAAKRSGRNRVVTEGTMPASPASPDEESRLLVLDGYVGAGAAGPDSCLDRVARLTASLFDMPIALVSLVGRTEQIFPGRAGIDADAMPREMGFCHHTIMGDEVFTVTDASLDTRFAEFDLVSGAQHLRFYAGAPLVSPLGGHRVGALCLLDRKPRAPLDAAQKALLTDLAALVVSHLEHARLSQVEA